MIELTNSLGNTLSVETDEQAAKWEAVGYHRTSEPKKATAKKTAASSKTEK